MYMSQQVYRKYMNHRKSDQPEERDRGNIGIRGRVANPKKENIGGCCVSRCFYVGQRTNTLAWWFAWWCRRKQEINIGYGLWIEKTFNVKK
jgi:hypothetical protein